MAFFGKIAPVILFLAGVIALGYGPEQDDGWTIVGLYAFLFAVSGYMLRFGRDEDYAIYRWLGILARFSLVFALPNLSDDVYRFVWDGRLILQGINPFDHTPRALLDAGNESLFQQLNSPDYYTVYPPLAQLSFALSAWLSPESVLGSAIVLKVIHASLDVGAILLLERLVKRWGLPRRNVQLYALNPLIIIELTGNLHFECAMVFFLALALWQMSRGRWYLSVWAWAGAIGAKLLPLMFLPFLLRRLGWPRVVYWHLLLGAGLFALFLPLLNSLFLANMGSSLGLYFRTFEFNASFYYLARWLGFQLKGYNLIHFIGPLFALTTLLAISWLAWREKSQDVRRLPCLWLMAITTYLLLSTTVHPWYLALPVFFSALTPFRFPLVWSAMAPLSYLAYATPEVRELPWVVWVEYLPVLGVMVWEARKNWD
jgi:hypothetical protein